VKKILDIIEKFILNHTNTLLQGYFTGMETKSALIKVGENNEVG
jgi:hypothetical protein